MYAIIDIKGQQHKVSKGDIIKIDKMDTDSKKSIDFDRVLYVSDSKNIQIGTPVVEGAKVTANVIGDIKGKKVISFKYKRRKGYSRKVGHRQQYTEIEITDISVGKSTTKKEAKPVEKEVKTETKTAVKKPAEKKATMKPAAKKTTATKKPVEKKAAPKKEIKKEEK